MSELATVLTLFLREGVLGGTVVAVPRCTSVFIISGSHRAFCARVYRKEKVRASVECCVAALRGTKKIDLFQPARLERGESVEKVVGAFAELLKEGKFDHLGLSECKAESLRRAHAVRSLPAVLVHKCLFLRRSTPSLLLRSR